MGTATGRCGVPVLWNLEGGSLAGFPLLVEEARSGELRERFAGMLEAEDVLVGLELGVECLDSAEVDSEDGGWMSTGTGVTGN